MILDVQDSDIDIPTLIQDSLNRFILLRTSAELSTGKTHTFGVDWSMIAHFVANCKLVFASLSILTN